MDAVFWLLVLGVAGWLTGKMIRERGYAETLSDYARDGADIVLGIVGGSIGGYLFSWAAIEKGGSFARNATAILGSIALVGAVRLISARNSASSLR